MRRLHRLLMLGRMVEKLLLSETGLVYLATRHHTEGGKSLVIEGVWPLTPEQTRLIREVLS